MFTRRAAAPAAATAETNAVRRMRRRQTPLSGFEVKRHLQGSSQVAHLAVAADARERLDLRLGPFQRVDELAVALPAGLVGDGVVSRLDPDLVRETPRRER